MITKKKNIRMDTAMFRLKKTQMEELDITSVCANCEYAHALVADGDMLCRFHGVVSENHTCRRFRYDLLKRKPAKRNAPLPSEPLPTLDDDEPEEKS